MVVMVLCTCLGFRAESFCLELSLYCPLLTFSDLSSLAVDVTSNQAHASLALDFVVDVIIIVIVIRILVIFARFSILPTARKSTRARKLLVAIVSMLSKLCQR